MQLAKRQQRLEIVAVVDGDEGTKCVNAFAGQYFQVATILHGDSSFTRVRHRDWQRNQARLRFEKADAEPHILPPHVHDRRAAAVVGVVHAEVILLREPGVERKHPVRALLVRTALIRPKGNWRRGILRINRVCVVVPLENRQLRFPGIRVGDVEDRKIRGVVVNRDGHSLFAALHRMCR